MGIKFTSAEIYYVNLPHPSESEIASKMWMILHHGNAQVITMPIGFYRTYYRKLPLTEKVELDLPIEPQLEKIFMKYNNEINPYSYQNNPGQKAIKEAGVKHTSMSVGDVIKIKDKRYIVLGRGFGKLVLQ